MRKIQFDKKGMMAYTKERGEWSGMGTPNNLFYISHQFKDGCKLGFWTHSPCGRCNDMEQGWIVIDKAGTAMIDSVSSKSMGGSTGEVRRWNKKQKEIHGMKTRISDWKMGGN